ncbi:MAG TPA: hypothetical protein EYG97_02600 [Arcobacter sp.]|nr:hypothetical protein [Arcobacter sp.]
MTKKNIFILRSPLQIINAIEAIEHFDLINNILILIYNKLDSNAKQMEELIDTYSWDKVVKLEQKSRSKLFDYVRLVKELKKESYHYLFFGNLGTIQKVIIANVNKEKVFLLDDGTSTITYYHEFIKPNKINKFNFREFRFLFFGLKFIVEDNINFFTYFDLKSIDTIEIHHNSLSKLKSKSTSTLQSEHTYFIGQPLDDIDILNETQYKNMLEEIANKEKIFYIHHRAESKSLKETIKSIKNINFEIVTTDMPLELYFLKNNIIPFKIISCYSTALTTMELMFKNIKIDIIKIPKNIVNNKIYYDKNLVKYYKEVNQDNIVNLEIFKGYEL